MVNLTSDYEEELPTRHCHYKRLQTRVRQTIPQIRITSIRQVNNKYLSLAFAVKKNEMRRQTKTDCNVEELIHATGAHKITSILKENLNWRLVTRSKFGRGVSFSPSASYANKYCNNRNGNSRAFIFCDVLVGNVMVVHDNYHNHPPKGKDSYRSMNGCVLVKFDDFTFNPTFIVYYENGAYHHSPYDYRVYSTPSKDQLQEDQQQRDLLRNLLRIPLHDRRPPVVKWTVKPDKVQPVSISKSHPISPPKLQPISQPVSPPKLKPISPPKLQPVSPPKLQPFSPPQRTSGTNQPIILPRGDTARIEIGIVSPSEVIPRHQPTVSPNNSRPNSSTRKILAIISIFGLLLIVLGLLISFSLIRL